MMNNYFLKLSSLACDIIPKDVAVRKGTKKVWPVLAGMAISEVEIPEGKCRMPHYHTNTSELSVIIKGNAKAGLIDPCQTMYEFDLAEGDCVFFPCGWPHWIRNTGKGSLKSYFNYNTDDPITVEVANMMSHLK